MLAGMPRLLAKYFATPDDVRIVPKARFDVVSLDDATMAYATFEPGWRWTVDMAPHLRLADVPHPSSRLHRLGDVARGHG